MRCLVTGATGFVGHRLVEALVEKGHEVRALVRAGREGHAFPDGVEVVVGDVMELASLHAATRNRQVVFHCAAAVGNHFSRADIYRVNLGGVRNVLDALRGSTTHIMYISSINVLGTRNLAHANEDTACCTSNDPAADVKIEAEALALEYYRKHGVAVTIIRPGFIYGPGDPHNLPKLISALKRGKFSYIGSKDNIVPMVHVDAVVQALILAAEHPQSAGRIYHILDESRISIEGFIAELCQLIHVPAPTKVLPYWIPAVGCQVFSLLKTIGLWKKPAPIAPNSLRFLGTSRTFDLSRARDELGYRYEVPLTETLKAAIGPYQEPHGVPGVSHATA